MAARGDFSWFVLRRLAAIGMSRIEEAMDLYEFRILRPCGHALVLALADFALLLGGHAPGQ
jgi:hypothetical protein